MILHYILKIILLFILILNWPLVVIRFSFNVVKHQLITVIQRRQGFNIIAFYGFFQPIINKLKVFEKKMLNILKLRQVIFLTVISNHIGTYAILINLNNSKSIRSLVGVVLSMQSIIEVLLVFSSVESSRHDIHLHGALNIFFLDIVSNLKLN